MKFRSIIEIFLCITIPFATSGVLSAYADGNDVRFATPQCNHNQLAPAVGELAKCETKIWQHYVEKMLKNYKDDANGGNAFDLQKQCKNHNDILHVNGKQCLVEFSKSCLPNYIETFFSEIHDAQKYNCDCPTPDYSCMPKTDKLQVAFKKLTKSCENDKDCPQSILSFDKQCTSVKRQQELTKAFTPCLTLVSKLWTNITNYIIGAYQNGLTVPLDRITPCETIRKVLDECFEENECFSQREMAMVRNMLAGAYHRGMGSFIQVDNEFGSLSEFVAAHNNLTIKWNEIELQLPTIVNTSDPTTKKWLELADHIVEDYK